MLNQIILVGRLVKEPELKELEDGKSVSNITLAIPRSFKNDAGEYDVDFIDCTIWGNVAKTTNEYCDKGDIIGIKGRLASNNFEKDGKKIYKIEVVAEKVTFLSPSKTKNDVDRDDR